MSHAAFQSHTFPDSFIKLDWNLLKHSGFTLSLYHHSPFSSPSVSVHFTWLKCSMHHVSLPNIHLFLQSLAGTPVQWESSYFSEWALRDLEWCIYVDEYCHLLENGQAAGLRKVGKPCDITDVEFFVYIWKLYVLMQNNHLKLKRFCLILILILISISRLLTLRPVQGF